ncbi:hypothetical protein [Blastococcus sp. SYSU D00813]
MSDTVGPVRAAQAGGGPAPDHPADGFPGHPGQALGQPAGRWTERRAGPVAGRWGGVAELRADLLPALRLTGLLVLAGVPAGLTWWLLSPVVHTVVIEGQTIAVESTATERAPAGDVVFTLVMAGLGLLGGLAVWLLRRHRGVTVLLGLAAGTALAGVVAWQLGEALVSWFGDSVETRVGPADAVLDLAALPALAVGPFVAVLVYVAGTLLAAGEDIGRDVS